MSDVHELVKRALNSLQEGKRDLSDEELLALQRPEAELELEVPLEGGAKAWLFSVRGWLHGGLVRHCLFRGSCVVILAPDSRQAAEWANEGLRSTLEALLEYHLASPDPRPMAATVIEAGGRKANPLAPPLATRFPALQEYLEQRYSKDKH